MQLLILALVGCCAFAQPAIYVRNAANPAASSDLAPGSLIEVGISSQGGAEPIDPGAVTIQLSTFGNQAPRVLPVISGKSPISVLAFVPSDVALGGASVQLLSNGIDRGSTNVTIVASSFALFSSNGLAVAQNISRDGRVELSGLTRPVAPGGSLSLWGTGLGQATRDQVLIAIGGIGPATIAYAGPSGIIGVDQINVQVPEDPAIPEGCYVAVDVQVGERPGYRSAIAFSRAGTGQCRHPFGLTSGELQELDAGRSVVVATASIDSSIGPFPKQPRDWGMFTRNEGANVLLLNLDAAGVAGQSGGALVADQALSHCSLSMDRGSAGAFVSAGSPNAGDRMNLAGPNGKTIDLPGPAFYYVNLPPAPAVLSPDAVPDSFFTPGTWTLSGAGSSEIAPFSVQFPVTPALRIIDAAGLSMIDRSRDTEIRWDARGYADAEVVNVSLYGAASPGSSLGCGYVLCSSTRAVISCTAPANAGVITIPAKLLQELDTDPVPASQPALLQTFLTRRADHLTTFRLVRTSDPTIPGFFRQSSAETFALTLR